MNKKLTSSGDLRRSLTFEDVKYDMAVPAKRLDVFLWLMTGGKKGKLFVRKTKDFKKWTPPKSFNCRCVAVKI